MKYTHPAMALFTAIMVAFAFTSAVEARDKQYEAMQVNNIVIDGNLNEWGAAYPTIALDEMKDGTTVLPDPADFSGVVMVGWSSSDPTRVYIAYIVTDDIIKDTNPPNDTWWEDDSAEIIFDFNNDGTNTKWAIGATGELGATATADNTEFAIVEGANNQRIYEIAVTGIAGFQATEGGIVGLSPIYDDGENGVRESQLGWIAGSANDNANQGDIIFAAASAVEPSGKLATAWGALKR
ncbi:sugar-binding protein [Candidatus Poribacteria bacterium]